MSNIEKLKFSKDQFYILFLTLFSILINQYFGYVGILPIDSFLIFNSGYDFLNGYYPFKDFWTIKEPFIDILQALFFKLFGVSWFSYVLHASFFNFLISISTYFSLKYFNLSSIESFFYSLCVAILTYPTAGTPFSDHHTLILNILSVYIFFVAVKKNNNFLWFCLPILLGCSFLSKQTPTSYIALMIGFLSLIFFINKRFLKSLFVSFLGLATFLLLFFLFLKLGNIKFNDFYTQYILFPKSLGETRLDWVFPLEFKRIVLRFKVHYLAASILFYLLFMNFFSKKVNLKFEDKIIITSLILTLFFFIFHQLMTINAIFIYCLIPIFSAFSHIYSKIYLKNNKINHFFLILTFIATTYYFFNYVQNRTFMDLNTFDLNKSVDGELIHKSFKNIRWLTMFYPEDPQKEIESIRNAMDILKKDKSVNMIITDYQFISVFLNKYDYSTTRFWYNFHGYPDPTNKYFDYWKNFNLKILKENNIENIFVFSPLHGDEKPIENIFDKCLIKEQLTSQLYKFNLNNCPELN
tara:strand:+ start:545 stop:2116 length:1572 start_codon:yes stop_codon:yes gene_type:complete